MKIAIVEDNELLQKLILDSLMVAFPTDDVRSFSDGESLLDSVANGLTINIAVIDIHLPGKNGFKIAHLVRQKYPDAMIIIYTNYDFPEYREVALENGADFFLSKEDNPPADLARLIRSENIKNFDNGLRF